MLPSLISRVAALGLVVIMALMALVFLLVRTSTETRESFRWVTHSATVIETTGDVLVELRDAESGQRGFVITRNPVFAQNFEQRILGARQSIDRVVALTADNQSQNARARTLRSLIDQRIAILRRPLDSARRGDFEQARNLIAFGHGREVMARVSDSAEEFLRAEHALQVTRIEAANSRLARLTNLALIGGPVLCALILLTSVLLARGIRRPLGIIQTAMTALGRGERDKHIVARMGSREFARLAKGYNAMVDQLDAAVADQVRSQRDLQAANEQLQRSSDTLRDHGAVIALLGGMAHRMQAARTDDELAQVIRVFVPRVLPGISGALYAHNNSRNLLMPIASWGDCEAQPDGFAPDHCWALRRGQSHFVEAPGSDIVCSHVHDEAGVYHCEPLLASGEVIGTLYLEGVVDAESHFRLAVLSENIASALVNHRLQRGLREQTIRDPLTGLFNRRYMEETLTMEIARARRTDAPLSLVMCDVDHFKRFNDDFGHDAGDVVLKAVANEMRNRFREGDVVCRYGGEEFTIIAPGTTAEALAARVEVVRQAITEISLRHGGRTLGSTSMSFGIATWTPNMDKNGAMLAQIADAALYRAKREGRNRAIVEMRDAA